MTIVRIRRQSASFPKIRSTVAVASVIFWSSILLASNAAAQNKGDDDDWLGFQSKSYLPGENISRRDDPRYWTADEVQALMQPSDDVQEWDAQLASPIIVRSPYQTRASSLYDDGHGDSLLVGIHFEDADFVDQVKTSYENINRGLVEGLFGEKAGQYFEIDIDKSPEIKFEIRFD